VDSISSSFGWSEGVAETESEGGKIKKLVIFVFPQPKIIMQQIYHANATTNINIRGQLQANAGAKTNAALAEQFNLCPQTVSKWKNRDFLEDLSSRPKTISYALSDLETALAVSIRAASWLPLDQVWEMMLPQNESVARSAVYRCFVRNNINTVPGPQKDKAKTFKAYQPGYLHVDVTYLPKLNGESSYPFVAIDRATRTLFYIVYPDKTARSTDDFFDKCLAFFPFVITHILTDNGLEFTNRLIRSKKGNLCTKPSLLDVKCEENDIDHRLTQPCTPKTNGMVERANGTIKNSTVLKNTYKEKDDMVLDLFQFLTFYNLYRRHGSLRKELKVKTPFQALEKWYELKPEIFKMNPETFKNNLLSLTQDLINFHPQRCET
jgi:transposase InsO family protein